MIKVWSRYYHTTLRAGEAIRTYRVGAKYERRQRLLVHVSIGSITSKICRRDIERKSLRDRGL